MSIILSDEDLKQLDTFIQELPVKYGLPLINFLNSISEKAQAESVKDTPVDLSE